MGIPLWKSPPTKSLDKSLATNGCNINPSAAPWNDHEEWTHSTDSSSPSSGSSGTSSSASSSSSNDVSTIAVAALTTRDETSPTSSRRRHGSMSAGRDIGTVDNNMLTLGEFLRETSQASAVTNEAERQLQTLLLMHRRADRDRVGEAVWRRSLFDHTPAGRLRLGLSSTASLSASPTATVVSLSVPNPDSGSSPSPPGIDSFDTLVSQIRRIGALQDVILNTVDSTTTNLEDSTNATVGGDPSTNRRDRSRGAVDGLRVREARLRAMQTRIDLLASEFALLRNTRRELRRVEEQALEMQDSQSSPLEFSGLSPMVRRLVHRGTLVRSAVNAVATGDDSSSMTFTPMSARPTITSSTLTAEPTPGVSESLDQPTQVPTSVDRRSPVMTESERDLMLRNAVMQMQIESLSTAGL